MSLKLNPQSSQTLHDLLEKAAAFLDSKLTGQKKIIRYCLTALIAEGHVLIESVPGLGKTTLAKNISQVISGKFSRIQMTSDLMPSDIMGTFKPTGNGFQLEFQKGPLFSNVLLADELNRTTPKTQSALLEAMAEFQVTLEGKTEKLDQPFFVIATQNPAHSHGVFALAESELDRFMFKIIMDHPLEKDEIQIYQNYIIDSKGEEKNNFIQISLEEFIEIKKQVKEVFIHEDVLRYIQKILKKTREHPQVQVGASIRAGLLFIQALKAYAYLMKKTYVTPEIVIELAPIVLAHRLVLVGHEIHQENSLEVIKNILDEIPIPQ